QQHRDNGERLGRSTTFSDPLDNTADEQRRNQTGTGKEQAAGHCQCHFLSATTEQVQQADEELHGSPCVLPHPGRRRLSEGFATQLSILVLPGNSQHRARGAFYDSWHPRARTPLTPKAEPCPVLSQAAS